MRFYALLCLAVFFVAGLGASAFASDDDAISDIDRERRFVMQIFNEMNEQKADQQKSQQADAEFLRKREEEKRVAAQFAGLSETLSGLPAPPAFKGTFQTQDLRQSSQDSELSTEKTDDAELAEILNPGR